MSYLVVFADCHVEVRYLNDPRVFTVQVGASHSLLFLLEWLILAGSTSLSVVLGCAVMKMTIRMGLT